MNTHELRFRWIRILDNAIESIEMELGAGVDDELIDNVVDVMESTACELRRRADEASSHANDLSADRGE